jgi:glycosyltransferase involved in cell wall biosynthesis
MPAEGAAGDRIEPSPPPPRNGTLAALRALRAAASSYLGRKYYLFGVRVRFRARFTRYDFCQAMDVMALFAARGFKARGIPVLLDVNEIPDPFERQGRHFIATPIAAKRHLAAAFARDMRAAAAIIATSDSMAEFVAERFGRDATAIRNARPPLAEAPSPAIRADVAAGPETRILIYPCTAAPHLGVETSIELLRRLPARYVLVFVGRFDTIAYRETIERLIRRLGLLTRVHLKGELPDADYLSYLAGADLGLVPLNFAFRNQRVVLPWRVIDLMAAGVPILASPSDEIRRIARDGDIGEIAASDRVEDLVAALGRFEAASPTRHAAVRRDLLAMAQRFSPPRQRARYRRVIEGLAPKRVGRAAFVTNLALRHNRRLIEFIDQLCGLGWRVDLYCVRAPSPSLFRAPDRVRFIARSDRLVPAWLTEAWRAARRRVASGSAAAPFYRLGDMLVGIWFGGRQLRRARGFARAIRGERRRRGPWDIVIATDIFALAAGLAAGRTGALLVYDAIEIPDLRQRTSRYLRCIPGPLRLPFRLWERAYLARAGLVFATSHALARYLRRRYRALPWGAVIAVRNGAEFGRAEILAGRRPPSLRRLLGLPEGDCLLVSPCGISAETGALVAVRMLRFLPADHVLLFIGRFSHGQAEAEIKDILRRQGTAHRCFFLGEVEYRLYLSYLAQCDIGLVLFDPAIANLRLAAPNRFFDLVAMEVPIVATAIEEVAPILRRAGTGIIVAERRPAAVARAVLELRRRLGIAGGGRLDPRARTRLRRLARFHQGDRERAGFVTALAAKGPLEGKRVALMTLRNAGSNRRFRRLGAALVEAGAALDAFDTDIGATAATPGPCAPWLTTIRLP